MLKRTIALSAIALIALSGCMPTLMATSATAGGALIVWNGFGHAPVNTPTSWLIATGGQMLLFLGIVTLVSSGLEQTSEDVNRQVRVLGEQLLRIEQGQAGQATAMPHAAPRSGTPRSRPAQPGSTGTTKPR